MTRRDVAEGGPDPAAIGAAGGREREVEAGQPAVEIGLDLAARLVEQRRVVLITSPTPMSLNYGPSHRAAGNILDEAAGNIIR